MTTFTKLRNSFQQQETGRSILKKLINFSLPTILQKNQERKILCSVHVVPERTAF